MKCLKFTVLMPMGMINERKIICCRHADRKSSDLSPRAVQTLADVDFIAAEDTRVTLKILNHFWYKKKKQSAIMSTISAKKASLSAQE